MFPIRGPSSHTELVAFFAPQVLTASGGLLGAFVALVAESAQEAGKFCSSGK